MLAGVSKRVIFICLIFVSLAFLSLTFLVPVNTASAQDICDGYQDYFDTFGFGQDYRLAQTFTPSTSHAVEYVELLLSHSYFGSAPCNPGLVTVAVQTTDSENKPSGEILAEGSIEGDLISGTSQVIRIDLTRCIELSAGTVYAIVASAENADSVGCVRWWIGDTGYNGGQLWEYSGGWSACTGYDAYFVVCGPSQCPEPSPAVGGDVYPVNKIALVLPWIAIAAAAATAIIVGGFVIVRRRVHS